MLANLQVVVVAFVGWVLLSASGPARERSAALPLVVAGAALISGVFETGAYGSDPAARGRLRARRRPSSYAGYLLLIRRGNRGGRYACGSLFDASAAAAGSAARRRRC